MTDWHFDATRLLYVRGDETLASKEIKVLLLLFLAGVHADLQDATGKMLDGSLSIGAWQTLMASTLRDAYAAAAKLGRGVPLDDLDRANIAADLRFAYERLERFARHVEAGMGATSEKQTRSRVRLYVTYASKVYEQARRRTATDAKDDAGPLFNYEMNVLGNAEHCAECLAETDKGWVSIGTLSLPGTRICLSNCKCHLEYSFAPVLEPAFA